MAAADILNAFHDILRASAASFFPRDGLDKRCGCSYNEMRANQAVCFLNCSSPGGLPRPVDP